MKEVDLPAVFKKSGGKTEVFIKAVTLNKMTLEELMEEIKVLGEVNSNGIER